MRAASLLFLVLFASVVSGRQGDLRLDSLAVAFTGHRGQVEVGGPYVGAEFHDSRPLPARISFFYPVANSIDLSTDYWRRGESRPFRLNLRFGDETEAAGEVPFSYRYTPFSVAFERNTPQYQLTITYRFCGDLPAMSVRIAVENRLADTTQVTLTSELAMVLRTCQTYTLLDGPRCEYSDGGTVFTASFDEPASDSACVFIINTGAMPAAAPTAAVGVETPSTHPSPRPAARFHYERTLPPGEKLVITQLVGSCRQVEREEMIERVRRYASASVEQYEEGVLDFAVGRGRIDGIEPAFAKTARWSRAMLAATRHYIDGRIVPMPCPAEYNFFFTHDLLLTDLGAVYFATERVREDLLYLHSLSREDSVLPHAYYWRDTGFQTEFCGPSNWNHLWFILLSGSYLRHSGDVETLRHLYPILKKSLSMMRSSRGGDGLMHADHPDWWDIGRKRGGRAYITALMVRALREYAAICQRLGETGEAVSGYLALADTMRHDLHERLWDARRGFLMNMLDSVSVDTHYYAGSLVAAAFDVMDRQDAEILLATARRELLDPNLGIRNVMPADFDKLIDVYRFNGMEMGAPYLYINGGVWPQGIVWYALGLLETGRTDEARAVLERHYTLDGIATSPGGQPAFFEYRNADARSPRYGEIDKPTFLWAGGWYLHALYRLAGVRENAWNIHLDPRLPGEWEDLTFDMAAHGDMVRVRYSGSGNYFGRILVDGRPAASAVLSGGEKEIVLERGEPAYPYLAEATAIVTGTAFDRATGELTVAVRGTPDQTVTLRLVSKTPPRETAGAGSAVVPSKIVRDGRVHVSRLVFQLDRGEQEVRIRF